jgi:hypothetical protein
VKILKDYAGKCGNKFMKIKLHTVNIVVTADCGHDRLELYFKQKRPVIDSQANDVNTVCILVTMKVGRYTGIHKLKNCTGEYGNKFT